MAVKLSKRAFDHAKKLIDEENVVFDERLSGFLAFAVAVRG